MRSILREQIFTSQNVARIKRLAYCILFMGLYDTFQKVSETCIFNKYVSLPGFKATFAESVDYFTLIFGLALLCIAEAMRLAWKMKEEHDLTI
jgi:hypothetical protein